jgi:ABC-2 type transport system permease protein
MKLRRSPIWLVFIIVPAVPAFLGTMNYLNNIEILRSEWFSLWTQHTLFTSYFFLPILLGLYCSYLMRLEKNNRNLTKLLTLPISRKELFVAKLLSAGKIILFTEVWIGVLFLISGKIAGLTAKPPVGSLVIWCLFGTLGGIAMAALQLIVSLLCDSFALPVGISFAGGISGLMVMSKGGWMYPYSLMAYGMVSNNNKQQLTAEGYPQFVLICLFYLAVFTAAGAMIMDRREV